MAVAYARGATARAQGEAATIRPNARYSEPRTPEQQQQHHNQYWLSNRELSCKMFLCLQQDVSMLLERVRRWNISTCVGNENLCLEMKRARDDRVQNIRCYFKLSVEVLTPTWRTKKRPFEEKWAKNSDSQWSSNHSLTVPLTKFVQPPLQLWPACLCFLCQLHDTCNCRLLPCPCSLHPDDSISTETKSAS